MASRKRPNLKNGATKPVSPVMRAIGIKNGGEAATKKEQSAPAVENDEHEKKEQAPQRPATRSRDIRKALNVRIPKLHHQALSKLVYDLKLSDESADKWKLVTAWLNAEKPGVSTARELLDNHAQEFEKGERVTLHVEIPMSERNKLLKWSYVLMLNGEDGEVWKLVTSLIAKHAGSKTSAHEALQVWETPRSAAA